ncbi:MAG: 16S rRNA (uracil(1498)-N(3))-methyltransferase [Marmoricola sp.]
MTLPVFWSPGLDTAAVGAETTLDGDEGRHAVVVRRTRTGEQLVLTDGGGRAATCVVTAVMKDSLTARVLAVEQTVRSRPQVTVVQAIPKGDRADLAVEALTEVGADRIVPWAAERCVAVWRGERTEKSLRRWRSTAREAAKQSRRRWFPEVAPRAGSGEVAELLRAADLAVVLHERADRPLGAVPSADSGSVVVVVGPEGGISPEELELLGAAGGRAVRMGGTVLRTSTAGVAAVAALLAGTPRWA